MYPIEIKNVWCDTCRMIMNEVSGGSPYFQYMCPNPICKQYDKLVTFTLSAKREILEGVNIE